MAFNITLLLQDHLTVSVSRNSAKKLSIDRVQQPKQYSYRLLHQIVTGILVSSRNSNRVMGIVGIKEKGLISLRNLFISRSGSRSKCNLHK